MDYFSKKTSSMSDMCQAAKYAALCATIKIFVRPAPTVEANPFLDILHDALRLLRKNKTIDRPIIYIYKPSNKIKT